MILLTETYWKVLARDELLHSNLQLHSGFSHVVFAPSVAISFNISSYICKMAFEAFMFLPFCFQSHSKFSISFVFPVGALLYDVPNIHICQPPVATN